MSATLLQGHPQSKKPGLPPVRPPFLPDAESFMDYHMNMAGPLDPKTGTFSSGRFAGQTPQQVSTYLQGLAAQSGIKPRAQMVQPTSAPVAPPPAKPAPSAATIATAGAQATQAVESAGTMTGMNPAATVGAMAGNTVAQTLKTPGVTPKKPSLINGQPSAQFFQDAANRQGRANTYGTVQPQAPAPTASPAPAAVATQATAVENRHPALFGKVEGITGTQAPLASAANPAPPATAFAMPQVNTRPPGVSPRSVSPSPTPTPAGGMGAIVQPVARAVQAGIKNLSQAISALPTPQVQYQNMTPEDSRAITGAANHNTQVLAPVMPSQILQGAKTSLSTALPGMTPTTYPSPAARVKGDFNTVNKLADSGAIRRAPKANPADPTIIQKGSLILR